MEDIRSLRNYNYCRRVRMIEVKKRQKQGKIVGPDDIPIVCKCLGNEEIEWLTNLFNNIEAKHATDWRASILILIYFNTYL